MNKADLAEYAMKRAKARGEVRIESNSMKDFANRDIRKNKSNLPNIILGSALIAGTLLAGGKVLAQRVDEQYLKPSDFQEAEWVQIDNHNGVIWDDYMKTKIPHNSDNWFAYNLEVNARNSGNLSGRIYVPIFDKKKEGIAKN